MRLLVNLLLVALTATGPSVCCCTAATISHAVIGQFDKAVGHSKKGPQRICCHPAHNRKPIKAASDKTARLTTRSLGQPGRAPEDRSCPCQEQQRVPVVSLTGEGDARPNPGSRDHQSPVLPFAVFMPPAGVHPDIGGST